MSHSGAEENPPLHGGELFEKFLEVQLSPKVSIKLPTVVVLDPAGGHTLLTDHLLDEPVTLPHVVKNHEDGGIAGQALCPGAVEPLATVIRHCNA